MSRRTIGCFTLILGLLAALGESFGIAFPTARWFFEASRDVPLLKWRFDGGLVSFEWFGKKITLLGYSPFEFLWFGWLSAAILVCVGIVLIIASFTGGPPNPVTLRRIRRFKEIRRGYFSLLILLALAGFAALDQVVVGKEALAVRYHDKWFFPAFKPTAFKGSDFGITGEGADAPVNYRKLKLQFKRDGGRGKVIMPLVPYGSTDDTLQPRSKSLVERQGIYHESGARNPFFGLAARYHDIEEGRVHLRYTLRRGKLSGPVDGWDAAGERVYSAEFKDGEKLKESYTGNGTLEGFLATESGELRAMKYHPAPPIPEERNWLGTTSQGYDTLAYLYGGLQVNFKAALIFLPIVYVVGITLGMLMGYLGGWFDLAMDRLIEVFSNIPFLFVVIIFASMVPEQFKGLPIILAILILFGWMGITALMRTAAYRDKERDYIAAARVLGAGTPRIIFRHLLPNTVAIIVTLVPFTVSSLISSLTALDYLGFGLPPEYATWGRLLNDGLSNLSAPWLVSSTFFVLVGLLVLITFIGEAVREAFDPKKYSYYR
jgi:microcin C transport system permease protein